MRGYMNVKYLKGNNKVNSVYKTTIKCIFFTSNYWEDEICRWVGWNYWRRENKIRLLQGQ